VRQEFGDAVGGFGHAILGVGAAAFELTKTPVPGCVQTA
jgi:hypothetical protein